MYVFRHPHYTYSSRPSFNLYNHMARCHIRSERHDANKGRVVLKVQRCNVIQQNRVKSTMIDVQPESVLLNRLDDTELSKTMSAVLYWSFLII